MCKVTNRGQLCGIVVHFYIEVVTVFYHWREGVHCREEPGNFQVEDVWV